MSSKGEITCNCQLGNECEGNFSHPSMVCCSYSNDPQTKVIWDMKKQIEVLKKQNEELKEDISVLNDDKEELFDAWLYYWSAAQLGCEHSIPMSDQEGGKYQLLLDKLGEEELQEENEEQLAAVECLKFMDYTYKDGQWMMDDEDEEEEEEED